MSNRTINIILGASLLFNIVLGAVLILNNMRQPEQGAADAQTPEPAVASLATDTPVPATAADEITNEPTATAQPSPTPTQPVTPTETAVPLPTDTPPPPTDTPPPAPTDTPLPTETPLPPPTNTPIAIPQSSWLAYINQFRQIAHLPAVTENLDFTAGSAWHSSYMVVNDAPIAHSEDPGNDLFAEIGDEAARNGNIFATTQTEARFNWAVNFWFSAPFHALPLLDPRLETIGYGDFVGDSGTFKMAAVTDVRSGIGELPASVTYPVFYPGDGSQTWIVRLSMLEWPDPYANCPGYQRPTGPAIILQLGTGELTPQVTAVAFINGDKVLESCTFNETNYVNDNVYAQEAGRSILDARDAIVMIPREQLIVGQTYSVFVTANGETYTWSFEVIKPPPVP
jgi:uncharacterized protein YkwD